MIERPKFFKRGKLLAGNRFIVLNRNLFKKFKEKHPDIELTYKEFYDITSAANLKIQDTILTDPSGFKIPLNIGYIAIKKFKPTNRLVNLVHRRMSGRFAFNVNLHSFEYMFAIKWFKVTESRLTSRMHCYQFKACRPMKARLVNIIKNGEGSKFVSYETKHFYSRKLLQKFNKHFNFSSEWD